MNKRAVSKLLRSKAKRQGLDPFANELILASPELERMLVQHIPACSNAACAGIGKPWRTGAYIRCSNCNVTLAVLTPALVRGLAQSDSVAITKEQSSTS